MTCLSRDPELMVVVDNPSNAGMLNEAARKHGLKLSVLVDLDPGMGRTGVAFQEGLALGRWIKSLPFTPSARDSMLCRARSTYPLFRTAPASVGRLAEPGG